MQPQYPCINTVHHRTPNFESAASAFTERAHYSIPVFHCILFLVPVSLGGLSFLRACDVTDGCASHLDQKGACVNLISLTERIVLSFRTFLPSPSPQTSLPENDIRFPSTLIKSRRLVARFRITMYVWDPGCLVSNTCGSVCCSERFLLGSLDNRPQRQRMPPVCKIQEKHSGM
jgi:hypothetical protein